MKNIPYVFLALAALIGTSAFSAEPEGKVDPILKKLASQLEHKLDLDPKPEIEFIDGNSLIVRYKTREYMIYPPDKGGRLGRDLVKDEGPEDDGFLLTIHTQKKGEVNQAAVPQTLLRPYWKTLLNIYPVERSDWQLYAGLSYLGRTDKELIEQVLDILKNTGVE